MAMWSRLTTIIAYIGVLVSPVPCRIEERTCSRIVNGMSRKIRFE